MLIAILVVANIPVFLFFGWVLFDTKEQAAESFVDTIIAILKVIFIPGFLRILMGMETEGAWGIFPLLLFLSACIGVIWIEHWLITTYIWPDLAV
ncbi:MAG: hypothetical protein RIC55_09100 [Pirellulaceae bacterium]